MRGEYLERCGPMGVVQSGVEVRRRRLVLTCLPSRLSSLSGLYRGGGDTISSHWCEVEWCGAEAKEPELFISTKTEYLHLIFPSLSWL